MTRNTSKWGLFILLICLARESKPYTEDKVDGGSTFYICLPYHLLTALTEPKVQRVKDMTWNCGNCGAEVEEGVKFCPNCGTSINWEQAWAQGTFTCGNCGEEFTGKVGFCPHCGTKINWETESSFMTKISDYFRNKKYTSWIFLILFGIIYYNIRTCDSSSNSYSKDNSVEKMGGSNSITEEGKEKAEREAREQKEKAERQAREQKEEAERQAREQKEAADQMEKLRKEVADAGYKKGYENGWEGRIHLEGEEQMYYKHKFGVPTSNEEKELFQLYEQKYREGYLDGRNAQ